jgi:hypothetical protein
VKTILVLLLSFLLSVGFANLSWAHGGGGGGGAGGGGGGAGGSGGGGSHGGGNGSSMGAGHGASMSFGHSSHGNTLSTRGGHSHSTLSHHGKNQTVSKSLAHHSRTHRHSITAQNETLRGKKKGFIDGLPPGLELQLDRGKSLPPGWQSKVGPGTVLTDTDTPADQALPPGQEIQADRGQEVTPTVNR